FLTPFGVAVGPDGNVYVADTGNGRIREIDLGAGLVSTYAGVGIQGFDGDGRDRRLAEFAYPGGVSFAPDGSLIVADTYNFRVRRVAPDGTVTTLAGSGPTALEIGFCGSTVPCGHYSGDGGPATEARL